MSNEPQIVYDVLCGDGQCPRIARTPDGSWLVQGPLAPNDILGSFQPTSGEVVVALPPEFVEGLIEELTRRK